MTTRDLLSFSALICFPRIVRTDEKDSQNFRPQKRPKRSTSSTFLIYQLEKCKYWEFPLHLSGLQTCYPWGFRFDSWPRSVGWVSGIAVNCGVGRRYGSDPALLWLWNRPAAVALIWPLAMEFPYAACAALKKKKRKAQAKVVSKEACYNCPTQLFVKCQIKVCIFLPMLHFSFYLRNALSVNNVA